MFGRKKYKSPHNVYKGNKIIQLAVVALLGYVIFTDIGTGPFRNASLTVKDEKKNSANELTEKSTTENSAGITDFINKIKTIKDEPVVVDNVTGQGKAVFCGDEVSLHYVQADLSGNVIPADDKGTPLNINIGKGQGIDKLIGIYTEGMKEGGIRQITLNKNIIANYIPEKQTAKPDTTNNTTKNPADNLIVYKILLEKVVSDYSESETFIGFKKFEEKNGKGLEAKCGDKVAFNYKVYGPKGNVVSKSEKPVEAFLGEGLIPRGLERGISGTTAGSDIFLVVPPSLLSNKTAKLLISLPDKEVLEIEISLEKVLK